jgi:hypothetical protein
MAGKDESDQSDRHKELMSMLLATPDDRELDRRRLEIESKQHLQTQIEASPEFAEHRAVRARLDRIDDEIRLYDAREDWNSESEEREELLRRRADAAEELERLQTVLDELKFPFVKGSTRRHD